MRRLTSLMVCLCSLVLGSAVAAEAEPIISLRTLLDELVDRSAITQFPEPAFQLHQASSYSRQSVAPDKPGWFANNDTTNFIRAEERNGRKEWVLMDAQGPGAIVRWWITSSAYRTTCRVYIDGSEIPEIEAKIADLVGGNFLVGEPLSEVRALGRNLFFPIPYAKSVKVTIDDLPTQRSLYYQINYRTYTESARVESFQKKQLESLGSVINAVRINLVGARPLAEVTSPTEAMAVSVPAGQRKVLVAQKTETPSAVQTFAVRVRAEDLPQALRSAVLSISFDGRETVWCPLGDFFGGGVGINPYHCHYSCVQKDGILVSSWVMPFQSQVEIACVNYGEAPVEVAPVAYIAPHPWTDRTMLFHADWKQDRHLPIKGPAEERDWNYITLKGKGVFAGDVLSLVNRSIAWWGEGDEKIFVDGEKFPSQFGTGTEDYYGYAWGTWEMFDSPFHAQPRAESPQNFGHVTNSRFRLLDGIPFQTHLTLDMEILSHAPSVMDYSVVTFWYGLGDVTRLDCPDKSRLIEEVRAKVLYETPLETNINEFIVKTMPNHGRVKTEQTPKREGDGWFDNDQIRWTSNRVGDTLEFLVNVPESGEQHIKAWLMRSRESGVVQFTLNGQPLGEPLDLYDASGQNPTGLLDLGKAILSAGQCVIGITIVGKNPDSKGTAVGIDRLRCEKAKIPTTHSDEARVPAYTLPDPLVFEDGRRVESPAMWRERRAEILRLFSEHLYGITPEIPLDGLCWETTSEGEAFGGKGLRREVRLFLDRDKTIVIADMLIYLPKLPKSLVAGKGVPVRVPVAMGLNFRGNHSVSSDPGITLGSVWVDAKKNNRTLVAATAKEETRGEQASRWCIETLLERGYAVVTAYYCQIEPDFDGGSQYGIRQHVSADDSDDTAWGAIGVWAWGLSRMMDYIERDGMDGRLDAHRVLLTGHSRLGKTALWAAAQDERFTAVVSNNSGCGGAALTRREFGETLWRMNTTFPHWCCRAARKYNDCVQDLPIDQHQLVALISPRGVYIASAAKDPWADPLGEFLSGVNASSVYQLLGCEGLGTSTQPPLNTPIGAAIRYHIRPGKHDITLYDWEQFLPFADAVNPARSSSSDRQ